MAPNPTSPPQARPHGPSFQQLLLLAFLLIAAVLGASALRAVFTLEALMGQSQASAVTTSHCATRSRPVRTRVPAMRPTGVRGRLIAAARSRAARASSSSAVPSGDTAHATNLLSNRLPHPCLPGHACEMVAAAR